MFWFGLLAGLIIWQFISLIFCFLWQENEDKFVLAATGLAGCICLLIIKLIEKSKSAYSRHKYKAALVDNTGKLCYCDSQKADEYIQSNQYFWAFFLRDRYTIEDGWRQKDCWAGAISLRYVPIKVLKAEGAYHLTD